MNPYDVTLRDVLAFQLVSGDWTSMIHMYPAVFKLFKLQAILM